MAVRNQPSRSRVITWSRPADSQHALGGKKTMNKTILAQFWGNSTGATTPAVALPKCSEMALIFCSVPAKVYPSAKRIHLILDNYGIHDSLQVRLAMRSAAAEKLELHFLPPYCPDHNRIERIWKDLHDNVTRNHRCTTMDELMVEVRSYVAARNRRGRHTYTRHESRMTRRVPKFCKAI